MKIKIKFPPLPHQQSLVLQTIIFAPVLAKYEWKKELVENYANLMNPIMANIFCLDPSL